MPSFDYGLKPPFTRFGSSAQDDGKRGLFIFILSGESFEEANEVEGRRVFLHL